MERWQGRVAVVTGASSGIGAAIAYQLQDAGLEVVALARRKDKIQSAVEEARSEAEGRGRTPIGKTKTPGKLHPLRCDVQKEEDIVAAFQWVKENLKSVHILVNNAGAVGNKKLDEAPAAEWKNILYTNVLGLSICTREAVQLMKSTGVDDGHIIHIGSSDAQIYVHLPGLTVCTASKTAVRVLTEGLRKELVAAKSKIRITEVSPGFVLTDIVNSIPITEEELEMFGVPKGGSWADLPHLKPEDVADAILYAVSTPAHVQIHEIFLRPLGEAM